jgi:anti-sigma factor RsiW
MKSGDEQLLTRYLLGELSEEERCTLEAEYFADPELFARLLSAEDDLIDAYVRGELSGEMRARFEERFRGSGDQLQRIAFASALKAQKPPRGM